MTYMSGGDSLRSGAISSVCTFTFTFIIIIIITYHDAGADGNGAAAVRVWHDVSVTDRQERD